MGPAPSFIPLALEGKYTPVFEGQSAPNPEPEHVSALPIAHPLPPQVPPRIRYKRALEYLLELYSLKEGFLYKCFHPANHQFRCIIKVPDPVAWQIYKGALIGSISLLAPGGGL